MDEVIINGMQYEHEHDVYGTFRRAQDNNTIKIGGRNNNKGPQKPSEDNEYAAFLRKCAEAEKCDRTRTRANLPDSNVAHRETKKIKKSFK